MLDKADGAKIVLPPAGTWGFCDAAAVGLTLRIAVLVEDEEVALIVTGFVVVTEDVETVKVAVVAPADTVVVGGTVAAEVLLLVRLTTVPPAGAAAVRVTRPEADAPPITDCGVTVRAAGD